MDFYSQQQYFTSAQLSSPISMQSMPDNESLLYAPELSSPFHSYAWQDPQLSALADSESMRRSISTPFLGDRAAMYTGYSYGTGNTSFDVDPCAVLSTLEAEEVVPASVNQSWKTNQEFWTPTHGNQPQATRARMPISTARPTMQRKHRPQPISTTMPRSFDSAVPHTAPIDRRVVRQNIERPVLSAKRSFEDFSDFSEPNADVLPYRHISTPVNKRTKSSQGFGRLSSSPFVDEPLFSPVYNDGLSLGLDPEQFLLSPSYSQTDFCSSPSYLLQNSHDNLQRYLLPDDTGRQDFLYNTPNSAPPIDIEGAWVNKYSSPRPMQTNASAKLSIPRNLNYDLSSPMRKTSSKPRRASTARAISFCNYTAADKKTILSGVAPSGSNKKAVGKVQEMTRSRSSVAIAV
ncbi:protein of unknown function [Taphrina deformans PYCC 5710]|uniref:Developmental regulatory protein wetA n=1 Tax=Taphrina deformans (strain PYCC 5710 / ATCC 11124 / CBS 356.35 / IMI 108563 / JCM 9778 / NBRC 8474) TaxID=1097556 RepID=R4XGD7_TAPDE|nr:protein of unknown function [Taphrina deformans PYCC 5710]|eukprot:CCG84962.1 protein of unknown function [Taphrina deformans PYCC 5710]